MVRKVFQKLVNNRIVDHLEKYELFSDFQYVFRSTTDLLTIFSDRTARAFKRFGATRAVALDISKLLTEFFFTNLSLMEIYCFYLLALFLVFSKIDDFEWFWMGSLS